MHDPKDEKNPPRGDYLSYPSLGYTQVIAFVVYRLTTHLSIWNSGHRNRLNIDTILCPCEVTLCRFDAEFLHEAFFRFAGNGCVYLKITLQTRPFKLAFK